MKFSARFPVYKMCKFLKVSKSGYYAFLKRIKKPSDSGKDTFLFNLIKECQTKNRQSYGYRRVKLWLLKNFGLVVNYKTILRVMNKYNLLSKIRRKRYYKRATEAIIRYKNLLKRNFKAVAPNQKWCTDISYLKAGKQTFFISTIKDLYDNFIVSYKLAARQDYGLVKETIKSALKSKDAKDQTILHSDRGFQYSCKAYNKLTTICNIIPSMSRPGTPIDNSPAENFFSILKSECLRFEKPESFEELKTIVDGYIYYYNYERLQLKTALTPFEYRFNYYHSA